MNTQSNFKKYLLIGIFFLAIVWVVGKYISDVYFLSKQRKYTITTRIRSGGGSNISGVTYQYFFTVNSKEYGGSTSSVRDADKNYFVEFYPPDPSNNAFTVIEATADDIKHLPPSGYDSLPHN